MRTEAAAAARSSAIAKLDEMRHQRTHIDGTCCSALVTRFVADQAGLPTRGDLHVETVGHALQRAAAENA